MQRQQNMSTQTRLPNNQTPPHQQFLQNPYTNSQTIPTNRIPTRQFPRHHINSLASIMSPPPPRHPHLHSHQQTGLRHQINRENTTATNNFDSIPDDVFMSIQIPQHENTQQKRKKVVRNPYKK